MNLYLDLPSDYTVPCSFDFQLFHVEYRLDLEFCLIDQRKEGEISNKVNHNGNDHPPVIVILHSM